MKWKVLFHDSFYAEFCEYSEAIQNNIVEHAKMIEAFGPQLGRPYVDTLIGSLYSNMKELRLDIDNGVWRIAFAFDPKRDAILLVAADKKGKHQTRFYKTLIKKADSRFKEHLERKK
jgi:hypothetical protein